MGLATGDAIFMANGLQPVSQETIQIDQSAVPLDVLAVLKTGDSKDDTEILITKPVGEYQAPLTLHRVERTDEGIISTKSNEKSEDEPFNVDVRGLRFQYKPHDTSHKGWTSIRSKSINGARSRLPTLTVSEASQPHRETPEDRRDHKKFVRNMKRLSTIALIAMAPMPGGIIDHVTDGSHSAKSYIEQQFGTIGRATSTIPKGGEEVDGPGTYMTHNELVQETKSEVGDHYAAVERVAKTFDDIDQHRFKLVKQRSAEFMKAHPVKSEIVKPEQRQAFKDRLEKSDNTKQALEILNEFMGLYGSHAYTGRDLSEKHVASSSFHNKLVFAGDRVIDSIGSLPKVMVSNVLGNEAWTDRGIVFDFGTKDRSDMGSMGKSLAHWGDGSGITLETSGLLDLGIAKIDFAGLKYNILHELSHGMFDDAITGQTQYIQPDVNTKYNTINRLENIASKLVSRPKFVSDYASSSSEEEKAEAGQEVLSGAIENPDHAGEFESRANRAKLAILIQLEQQYPGIADYLITELSPDLLK